MRIVSSAPTRIDLAGGTLDIWPLYLAHRRAQTVNVAIDLRARCVLETHAHPTIRVRSNDTGRTIEVTHPSALIPIPEFSLVGRALELFETNGLEIATESDSPLGAGIAGSSALAVALCSALARWVDRPVPPETLLAIAMNVEAQTIGVPTGVQDYRPALYGGVSAIELRADGVHRIGLDVDTMELERRIVLAYTGASRQSGLNNWAITKRHIDGDRQVFDSLEEINRIAERMRSALAADDWSAVSRLIGLEWDQRKALAPAVTTPAIESLMARARDAGATAAKICGAGGGGCLICAVEPDDAAAVRGALAEAGATLLEYHVDHTGLVVDASSA